MIVFRQQRGATGDAGHEAIYPTLIGDSASRRWYWNWADVDNGGQAHRFISPQGVLGTQAHWAEASSFGPKAYALSIDADLSCGAPCLSASKSSGRLGPGESTLVQLTIDARALPAGEYRADYCLSSNDAQSSYRVVEIRLHVP